MATQPSEKVKKKNSFDKRDQFFTKLNIKRINKKLNHNSVYIDISKLDSIVYCILIIEQILFKVNGKNHHPL